MPPPKRSTIPLRSNVAVINFWFCGLNVSIDYSHFPLVESFVDRSPPTAFRIAPIARVSRLLCPLH
jgi:hypothetical protein